MGRFGKLIGAVLMGVGTASGAVVGVSSTSSAATATILTLPTSSQVLLLSASSDGRYFTYVADNPSNGVETLHWYDSATATDLQVAATCNSQCLPHMSADGQHIVFEAWGGDPFGQGLVDGTIYEWNVDAEGNTSIAQISPTSQTYSDGGLEDEYMDPTVSPDGSAVAYEYRLATQNTCCTSGTGLWTASGGNYLNVPESDTWWDRTVLSSDGTLFARESGGREIHEYSTTDGSLIRSLVVPQSVSNQVGLYGISSDGSYGVGFSFGAQTGYAYFDFGAGTAQVIANTEDGQCTGSDWAPISISADGQTVAFGSLSNGLVPDSAGGSLGYFAYDPVTQQVLNESGGYAGPPPSDDCPSEAMSADGQNLYFVSYQAPPASSASRPLDAAATGQTAPATASSAYIDHSTVPPIAVATTQLPLGEVARSYQASLAVFGGTAPFHWAMTAGTLPGGLTFDSSTSTVSGTPTQTGTFDLTIGLTDSSTPTKQTSAAVSLTINPPVSMVTTSLPGGGYGNQYSCAPYRVNGESRPTRGR